MITFIFAPSYLSMHILSFVLVIIVITVINDFMNLLESSFI